jgi:hypothetical protein
MNAAIEKDCAQAAADGRDELYLIIGGSPGAVLKVTRGLHAKGRLLKWNDDITYDIPADGTAIGGLFRLIPRIKPAHKAADEDRRKRRMSFIISCSIHSAACSAQLPMISNYSDTIRIIQIYSTKKSHRLMSRCMTNTKGCFMQV